MHPPTSVPFSSILNERYIKRCGPFLMGKGFIEPSNTVNELTTQTGVPSTSGKELNSTEDTHLAASQKNDSTSEPDNKSKDGSIDPPQNQGDETDPKEYPDDNSQSEHGSDQGSETNSKSFAQPTCSWSITSKG